MTAVQEPAAGRTHLPDLFLSRSKGGSAGTGSDIPRKQRAWRSSRWGTGRTHSNSPVKPGGSVFKGEPAYRLHPCPHMHLPRKRPPGPPNPDHATLLLGCPVSLWVPTLHPAQVPRPSRHSLESRCSAPPRRLGYRRADTAPAASSRSSAAPRAQGPGRQARASSQPAAARAAFVAAPRARPIGCQEQVAAASAGHLPGLALF